MLAICLEPVLKDMSSHNHPKVTVRKWVGGDSALAYRRVVPVTLGGGRRSDAAGSAELPHLDSARFGRQASQNSTVPESHSCCGVHLTGAIYLVRFPTQLQRPLGPRLEYVEG